MQRSRENLDYILTMRQEPKQARMCGVGDRRPIDPPPIIQLRVIDANTPVDQQDAHSRDFLQNPYYFMFASLAKPDSENELHTLKDGKTKCTTGSVVSSLYHLKDFENENEDAGFFVFPDLSVRIEGSYRLKLSLYEVVGDSVRHCKSIFSSSFYVYTAKKFPGMEESTQLSCALAEQGLKIRIRKDVRIRKREANFEEDGEDGDAEVDGVNTPASSSSAPKRKGKGPVKKARTMDETKSLQVLPAWPQADHSNLDFAGPVGGVGAPPVKVPILSPIASPSSSSIILPESSTPLPQNATIAAEKSPSPVPRIETTQIANPPSSATPTNTSSYAYDAYSAPQSSEPGRNYAESSTAPYSSEPVFQPINTSWAHAPPNPAYEMYSRPPPHSMTPRPSPISPYTTPSYAVPHPPFMPQYEYPTHQGWYSQTPTPTTPTQPNYMTNEGAMYAGGYGQYRPQHSFPPQTIDYAQGSWSHGSGPHTHSTAQSVPPPPPAPPQHQQHHQWDSSSSSDQQHRFEYGEPYAPQNTSDRIRLAPLRNDAATKNGGVHIDGRLDRDDRQQQ